MEPSPVSVHTLPPLSNQSPSVVTFNPPSETHHVQPDRNREFTENYVLDISRDEAPISLPMPVDEPQDDATVPVVSRIGDKSSTMVHGDLSQMTSVVSVATPRSLSETAPLSPPKEEQKGNPTTTPRAWRVSAWLLETIFLLVSFACFAAIVIVLRVFDNQALPTLSLNLTLNTLIAFLATISKAALMLPIAEAISQVKWQWFSADRPLSDFQVFDSASRGIWGSLSLLRTTRWSLLGLSCQLSLSVKEKQSNQEPRSRSIATLGALVSIVGIVTSPIIQQCLIYPTRLIPDGGRVASTFASTYISEPVDDYALAFPISFLFDSLAVVAQSSTVGSDNPSIGALRPDCPTGQCTFSDIKTIGLCVKYADLSSEVSVTRIPNSTFEDWSSTWATRSYGNTSWVGTDAWNLTVLAADIWIATPVPWLLVTVQLNKTIAFADDEDLQRVAIWDQVFLFISGPNMTIPSYNEYSPPPGYALEVIFYPCAQELSIAVVDNQVEQNMTVLPTEVVQGRSEPSYGYLCIDPKTGQQTTGLQYRDCAVMGLPETGPGQLIFTEPSDSIRTYNISYGVLGRISGHLGYWFLGQWAWNGGAVAWTTTPNMVDMIADEAMWKHDPGQIMDTIRTRATELAMSITNLLRIYPTQFSDAHQVNGTTWTTAPYVHVRWGWVGFLAAQLITGTIFLAWVIFTSRRHRGGLAGASSLATNSIVLKSSALAVLFALNDKSRKMTGPVQEVREMKLRIAGLVGRMEDGELVVKQKEAGNE